MISFVNKIFHPNIEGKSGTICLNLLGSDWNPTYDLLNIINPYIINLDLLVGINNTYFDKQFELNIVKYILLDFLK